MKNAGSIGGGVLLFVIGAILSFALQIEWDVMDISLIGYILMGAGVVLFLIGMISAFTSNKKRTEIRRDPATGSEVRESDL